MATFLSYDCVGDEVCNHSTVTAASTAEIVLGVNCLFLFSADDDMFIRFGNSGMTAATNADFYIPAKTIVRFDTGITHTSVRVFGAGTSKNIYIQKLNRN